jgi:ubiquinone/menaquinone biosynthesis C-methylase UbiE
MAREADPSPGAGDVSAVERMTRDILSDPFFGAAVRFVLAKIGDVSDKTIVDVGCGPGRMSVFFALHGARVIGIDKRRSAVEESRRLARSYAVDGRCLFLQGSSESMPLGAETIDLVFSRSTLQYMDRERVLRAYARIVKPSGGLALIENLPHNPFINVYRLRRRYFPTTPSELEHLQAFRGYLTLREVEYLGEDFQVVDHEEFHFSRMISMYLRQRFGGAVAGAIDRLFARLDRAAFRRFPFLRRFAWFTAVVCTGKRHV